MQRHLLPRQRQNAPWVRVSVPAPRRHRGRTMRVPWMRLLRPMGVRLSPVIRLACDVAPFLILALVEKEGRDRSGVLQGLAQVCVRTRQTPATLKRARIYRAAHIRVMCVSVDLF